MQQRNDSLLSVEPANLLDLPDEVLCDEVLPNLGVNSLVALESANQRIKALLPKAWEAKHALYFPRANQETVQWLLRRGVTWFNIFMNDYQNQHVLRQFERGFKGSKINEVIDCLLRRDCHGLRLLEIDWRQFYSWMTTPLNSSLQDIQPTDAYFIILIANSSDDIRQYIYQNLKNIYEKENLLSLKRENMEWLVKLVCRQPLPREGNNFERRVALNDVWHMSLLNMAIVSRNVKVVTEIFQWAMSLDGVRRLDILRSGLALIAQIGFHGLSSGETEEYIKWFENYKKLNSVSFIDTLPAFISVMGKNGDIELVKKLAEMYLNAIDLFDRPDDLIVWSIFEGFRNNPAEFFAFCKRHGIEVSMNALIPLSSRMIEHGSYELAEHVLKVDGKSISLTDLQIHKLFRDACIDINKLKWLSSYLSFHKDWVRSNLLTGSDWAALVRMYSRTSAVAINPQNIFHCVASLLELKGDYSIDYRVMLTVVYRVSILYKAHKDELYLAFLKVLNGYWFNKQAEFSDFINGLFHSIHEKHFDVMLELVFKATNISRDDVERILGKLALPEDAPPLAVPDADGPVQFMDDVCHAAREAIKQNPHRESEIKRALTLLEDRGASSDKADDDKLNEVSSAFMQDPSPSMRALGIAMMVAGTLLAIAGTLIIAASMFAAVTGVLAVLAAPGMTVGIPLTVTGTGIALAGFGMFSGKQAVLSEMSSEQQLGFSV